MKNIQTIKWPAPLAADLGAESRDAWLTGRAVKNKRLSIEQLTAYNLQRAI